MPRLPVTVTLSSICRGEVDHHGVGAFRDGNKLHTIAERRHGDAEFVIAPRDQPLEAELAVGIGVGLAQLQPVGAEDADQRRRQPALTVAVENDAVERRRRTAAASPPAGACT